MGRVRMDGGFAIARVVIVRIMKGESERIELWEFSWVIFLSFFSFSNMQ